MKMLVYPYGLEGKNKKITVNRNGNNIQPIGFTEVVSVVTDEHHISCVESFYSLKILKITFVDHGPIASNLFETVLTLTMKALEID